MSTSLPPPIDQYPKNESRRSIGRKILLVFGGTLALIGVGFVALFLWAMRGVDVAEQAGIEGKAYGSSAYDSACLTKAEEDLTYGYSGHFGMAQAEFLQQCLSVADMTPGFCRGVPLPSDEDATTSWYAEKCGEREDIAGMSCRGLYHSVQYYCLERMAR